MYDTSEYITKPAQQSDPSISKVTYKRDMYMSKATHVLLCDYITKPTKQAHMYENRPTKETHVY